MSFTASAQLMQPQLDELTKFMATMPGNNQRARNAALSSIGYKYKSLVKSNVANNGLGWPDVSALTKATRANPTPNKRNIINSITLGGKAVNRIWGMLANLVVYSLEKESGALLMGFQAGTFGRKLAYTTAPLGPDGKPVNGSWGQNQGGKKVYVDNVVKQSAVDLANALTNGFQNVVNTKRQRYFAALGFFFKTGTILNVPARPLIGPVWKKLAPLVPNLFADKFWERMRKYSGEVGAAIETVFRAA